MLVCYYCQFYGGTMPDICHSMRFGYTQLHISEVVAKILLFFYLMRLIFTRRIRRAVPCASKLVDVFSSDFFWDTRLLF